MSQQYSLRWNNHQPNFISMFTSLLNTQTLVDVTLAADGRQLLAHKVVLSACSTYFQSLFVDNPSPHPIVILKDVTYAELRTMVDFMYCGEVNVTEEQLPKVLDTAKLLKIKGLTEMPDSTSLTRSQGTSVDLQGDSDSQRQSPVPAAKRRRRRQSSSASYTQPLYVDESRVEMGSQPIEAVTLSSLPQQQQQQQQRRVREYNEIRTIDTAQQTNDQSHENIPMDDIHEVMDVPTPLPQGPWSMDYNNRYPNACMGNALPACGDGSGMPGMYNVNSQPMEDISYGQALGVPQPSPGPSCVAAPTRVAAPSPSIAGAHPGRVTKRRRSKNPQAEENFQLALEAVRVGGIGFCKAARIFGVNNRTLWLEYKKRGYPNHRPSIKSRIKRERTSPSPLLKEEQQPHEHRPQDQQMALVCPQHQLPPPPPPAFANTPGAQHFAMTLETVAAPTSPTSEGRNRRSKHFRRQQRVPEDPRGVRKQMSEPPIIMPKVIHTLQKHESYPQFSTKTLTRRPRTEQEVGSLLIRAVAITPTERQSSSTTGTSASASASFESTASESSTTPRASHTPAVRSGPPLSCNFCWNTVDECGRILRRKTQYHCPECRTNLCIVPCFHEYHEGPETDASANAR